MKLVCFDMDGVLFKQANFWMELHKKFGTFEEGKEITDKYLFTNYPKMVDQVVGGLWKGRDAAIYHELVDSIPYLPGVKEVFEHIKRKGFATAIISGAAHDVALRVKRDFGVDYVFANKLVVKDGKVTGEFVWPVAYGKERKANIIRNLCSELDIDTSDCIYIGDHDIDIEAFKEAGVAIAFNSSSEKLKAEATHVVESDNAADLIPLIK